MRFRLAYDKPSQLNLATEANKYFVHDHILVSQHGNGVKLQNDLEQKHHSAFDRSFGRPEWHRRSMTWDAIVEEALRKHEDFVPQEKPYRLYPPLDKTGYTSSLKNVNGIRVDAFPDSGADICFISPNLTSSLGLFPTAGTEKMIKLANNKVIRSPGMVEVSWKFAKGQKTRLLNYWIIPDCVHDLILGNHFLRATEILTTFKYHIKSRLATLPRRLRLRLVGQEKQRLWGSLNGHPTAALADTGSDIMVISSEYARKHSLVVEKDSENWLEVEFADGSTDWTSGVVRDVTWDVGGETVRCDFHVLDGLSVDVILSKDYLFDLNVFSEHAEWFFDTNTTENIFNLHNIRLIGRYGDALNSLEEDYLEDINSPEAFGPEMVQRELARRDQIRDEILNLPENEQEEATRAEAERQRQWQSRRQTHRARWRVTLPTRHDNNAHRTEIYGGPAQSSEDPLIKEGAREIFKALVTSGMLWRKRSAQYPFL